MTYHFSERQTLYAIMFIQTFEGITLNLPIGTFGSINSLEGLTLHLGNHDRKRQLLIVVKTGSTVATFISNVL